MTCVCGDFCDKVTCLCVYTWLEIKYRVFVLIVATPRRLSDAVCLYVDHPLTFWRMCRFIVIKHFMVAFLSGDTYLRLGDSATVVHGNVILCNFFYTHDLR